ncbi:unnamed protein product [Linum tenue]|uniref:Heat shock protein 70 n=1 Tax=Linum tenue TaxID=586396 RepID=A0AAV0IJH9_9ROSI|nr:unnamed protein product [Linum tenue]
MGAYNSKAEAAVYAKTNEESLKQNKEEVMKTTDHEDLVYDKTPLSIGSAHTYDEMWVEIPKNTAIPTKKFEFVTFTASDNQETMTIAFYQGERTRASDNKLLGALEFKGIRPAPRGVAKITVCLDVDAKGNLNASAEDKSTGRKETMSITGVGVRGKLLSAEEVVEMARQGVKHKLEDDEYLMKVIVMKVMKEYTMKIRENAAAGAYSRKAEDEFRVVAEKMLDELKEKAKDFGLELGRLCMCKT